MTILHITDFHFKSITTLQKNVIDSIIAEIKRKNLIIDFVFFTGDLVQNGNKEENFQKAKLALFDRLSDELKIDIKNIIFCAGNHDINRNAVHGAVRPYLIENISTDDTLNSFYEKKEEVFIDSIKPCEIFNKFLKDNSDKDDIISDLFSIHIRTHADSKIGIVCLNSAWLSAIDKLKTGKDDKENLLIPISLLEEIKRKMGRVDKRIILVHHPLYFLKDFNFNTVEKFVHNEFDVMFSGHVHKISSSSHYCGSNGIFDHVSKSSLSDDEGLGCSIITLNYIVENQISVEEITYIKESNKCICSDKVIHILPSGEEKLEQIRFRSKIYDKIGIEKENANNLLLLNNDNENCDFLSLFNHPLIKTEPEGGRETKVTPQISFDELMTFQNNYLILGKDKCGKTSLLKRIQLECLMKYSRIGKIPFLFDVRIFETQLNDKFNIETIINQYYGNNRNKTQQILESGDFLLLIDNYDRTSGVSDTLNDFLFKYPDISYIICSEYNVSRTVEIYNFGNSTYEKLYFHDLRRREIVAYTEKRLSPTQNKEEIQEKIVALCKQLELPLNYWTISLLLLIYKKSNDNYYKNLFEILDICVDEILGKKYLLISKSRISYDQLKKICGELSKDLFTNHKMSTYSASVVDILKCIETTLSENERITAGSHEIFEYLVSSSILKLQSNNNYVFRLNGFFEYFLAYQMTKDSSFKDEILNDEVKYLAFKNQLEIYSGFKRDDSDFLTRIFNKTKLKVDPSFNSYNSNKDIELLTKIKEPEHIEELSRNLSIKKALSSIEIAEIEDTSDEMLINADVHEMFEFDPNQINSELIERYLSILSRVFRNSDEISGHKHLVDSAFNYIIDAYCNFGFYLIDEYSLISKQEIINEDHNIYDSPALNLLRLISNFAPMICQICLYDGIGHFNLEKMIKDEIIKLEEDIANNQFKLFMLYFLLIDIDIKVNKDYIDKAIDNIKIPILKSAIVFKLNYYLAFKGGDNKYLQQLLSQKIQLAKHKLDSKKKVEEIQNQIQISKKTSILKSIGDN